MYVLGGSETFGMAGSMYMKLFNYPTVFFPPPRYVHCLQQHDSALFKSLKCSLFPALLLFITLGVSEMQSFVACCYHQAPIKWVHWCLSEGSAYLRATPQLFTVSFHVCSLECILASRSQHHSRIVSCLSMKTKVTTRTCRDFDPTALVSRRTILLSNSFP